jgi:hypothetical protein
LLIEQAGLPISSIFIEFNGVRRGCGMRWIFLDWSNVKGNEHFLGEGSLESKHKCAEV